MDYYHPIAVANFFLERGMEDGQGVSNLKLQKLLYFAHGYRLAIDGYGLLREDFQAWDHGPVCPSAYFEFREFGWDPITRFGEILDTSGDEHEVIVPRVRGAEIEELLGAVWRIYGRYSAAQLREFTHRKGTAWSRAKSRAPREHALVIPADEIRDEFSRLSS